MGGLRELALPYDDTTMVLNGFDVRNASAKTLIVAMVAPRLFTRSFSAGAAVSLDLPVGQRPTWEWKTETTPETGLRQKISGLTWRAWVT